MLKSLSALLLVFSAAPAFSFDLQTLDAAAVKETPAAIAAPAAPKAASGHVWMTVRNNPGFKEAEANDWSARIEARVRETFKDSYSVSLRADMDSSWGSIRKTGSYYNLTGSGVYLNMGGSNGSYFINGTVTENGKTIPVGVNVSRRFDDFSFNVFGSGLNLYTDRNSVNGNYDTDRFSKKAVAAVTSLLLAVQVEKGQPKPEEKSVRAQERVWLTIRPGFGWNTVEANDPFSRIEVGLRKIFDREYDAEIETDNNHVFGRVSGFFTRRYELRAGRTDLRMEEWAGSWRLTGRVEAQGAPNGEQAVNLEMRDRFGDGSFYIWESAINLNIDRNGVSGTVDTSVYPKEVVGAITALVMAYQQDNLPQQPK
ncbi:MAG: hypothetical protein A2X31_02915 [Elusimicrobia bacterium GWB2_63_22]|nr:MAG: hypothetical protein A2X31_02915 [Elusimicrobia bacterium GWB2_63_22]